MAMTSPDASPEPAPAPQQPAEPFTPAPYPPPPPGYGPPYQPYPQRPPIAPGKKKGMPGWAIALIVVGGVIVLVCGGALALVGLGAKGISDSNTAAKRDVSIQSCTDSGGLVGPEATIAVTNHGSRTASYTIEVTFTSPSGAEQYGTGTAIVNRLAPGQSTTATATSFAAGKTGGGQFQCKVTDITKI